MSDNYSSSSKDCGSCCVIRWLVVHCVPYHVCMYTATQTLVLTEQSEDQENEDDPFISANNEVYNYITIV